MDDPPEPAAAPEEPEQPEEPDEPAATEPAEAAPDPGRAGLLDEELVASGKLRSAESETFGSERARARACPWCMAPLADEDAERCPSCGAQLRAVVPDAEIPGLTTLSPEAAQALAAAEGKRTVRAPSVAEQLGWRVLDEGGPAFEPPSDEVRREIERLEREAAAARAADTTVEPPEQAPEEASRASPETEPGGPG